MSVRVGLVFPPGWPLTVGGPHLGLPLLCGRLDPSNTVVLDLNLVSPGRAQGGISEDGARRSWAEGTSLELYRSSAALGQAGWSAPFTFEPTTGLSLDGPSGDPQYLREMVESVELPSFFVDSLQTLEGCAIIGISVASLPQLPHALMIARQLRAADVERTILLGGNVITRLGVSLAVPWVRTLVDGLVMLQGEIPLSEIVARHEKGDRVLAGIANVISWEGGEVRAAPKVPLPRSRFSSWDFRHFPVGQYWGANYLPVMLARGCYYGKCAFCAIPYGYGEDRWLGLDDVAAVGASIVRDVAQTGVQRLKFVEEALHPVGISRLAEFLLQEAPSIEFEGYARLDPYLLDDSLLARLSRAGLRKLYLGVELGPTVDRAILGKNDLRDPVTVLRQLDAHGILAHCFMIVGYPGTTVSDAIASVRFALDHRDLIDTLDLFPFYLARHTSVVGVEVDQDSVAPWDLSLPFRPTQPGVLGADAVCELSMALEEVVWDAVPKWLDPVYRMISPWSKLGTIPGPPMKGLHPPS